MADASRDDNNVPTLLAVSAADGVTPVAVYANPDTHRLLTEASAGVTGPNSSTTGAVVVWGGTQGEQLLDSTLVPGVTTTAPATTNTPVFTSFYGGNTKGMGDPVAWWQLQIGGVTYKIPLYT